MNWFARKNEPVFRRLVRPGFTLALLGMLAGCGGGGSNAGGASIVSVGPSPAAVSAASTQTGNVLVTNQTANSRASSIGGATQYVYTAYDSSNKLVYGPISDPPSVQQLLQNVPVAATQLDVDYLKADGTAVGYTDSVAIAVSPGATATAKATAVVQPNQWTARAPYANSFSPFSHSVGVCYAGPGSGHPDVGQDLNTMVVTDGFKMLHLYHVYTGSSAPFTFDPAIKAVLDYAKTNNVELLLGTLNSDVATTFQTVSGAQAWLSQLQPYLTAGTIKVIALANEPNDKRQGAANISPATFATAANNLRQALSSAGFPNLPISTCLVYGGLTSYPPAAARFQDDAVTYSMEGYIRAIVATNSQPFVFVNILPSYTVTDVVNQVPSTASWYPQFGLFTSTTDPAQKDGNLNPYWDLSDLQYNTVLIAEKAAGLSNVQVFIGESGWPDAGNGPFTTPTNEATYINNFLGKWIFPQTSGGGKSVPTFLFEAFNEPNRDATQANWGLRNNGGSLKPGIAIPSWVSTQ